MKKSFVLLRRLLRRERNGEASKAILRMIEMNISIEARDGQVMVGYEKRNLSRLTKQNVRTRSDTRDRGTWK